MIEPPALGRFSHRKGGPMLIRHVNQTDWEVIADIEQANFSPQEAVAANVIKERAELISDTFLVAVIANQLVGYIEGPVIAEPRLEDHLFHGVTKNPARGGYIAITSLSVAPGYQKQGIGTALLAAMKDLAVAQDRLGIILTCHDYLIPYYEMNGFQDQGLSASQHGGSVWYQMLWQPEEGY